MNSEQTSRVKDKYKVCNWKADNKSLVQRGEIGIWLDASVMRAWRGVPKRKVVVGAYDDFAFREVLGPDAR